ncbi:dienelactone hydrolase [Metarhizium robertsii]|uniref:Dienelactone hydrolase n=1 Tax=Metarhizium robertsii TaxID=568076 RepID=A0A014MZ47_9HYPO|nr:dienelactone hydrolase [Metarhizium robertsii]
MSCPDCFRGQIHEGETKGKVIKHYGFDTYVSEPPNGTTPKGIIVVIPDAFGWAFPNNRILADTYAEKGGFKVYLPDFMNDRTSPRQSLLPLVSSPDHQIAYVTIPLTQRSIAAVQTILAAVPFFIRCAPGRTYPGVKGFFEQLRKEEGQALPIGAAGFCWGGKHTVTLAHGAEINGQPLIDAGFTGHPSLLSLPSDVEKIKRPVSFACAEDDNQISLKQAEQIKAIVTAFPEPYKGELRVYQKTGHGFAVRADLKVPDVAAQAAAAEDQAIAWFTSHFSTAT